jgi:hypothetical protein
VKLRAEAIPVSWVLRRLTEATGVSLEAASPAGDERLVAFVPEAPLAEVLLAVADLHRLEWVKTGGGDRPKYRLYKPDRMAREEQLLRNRALRDLLDRMMALLRKPPAGDPSMPSGAKWSLLYPDLLPILGARRDQIAREGYLYLPLSALPRAQRDAFLAKLRPVLGAWDAFHNAGIREIQAREQVEGGPGIIHSPISSVAERSVVTVGLELDQGLQVSAGLRTQSVTWFPWFSVPANDARDEADRLYHDRRPRLPITVGGHASGAAADNHDPFQRIVAIPPPAAPKRGDWMGALARLSDAAHVAIYSDRYQRSLPFGGGHPRGAFSLPARTSVESALDAICFPVERDPLTQRPRRASSFWWRREGAGLIRSREWLWEALTPVPAERLERVMQSVRKTGKLEPASLPALAGLTLLQWRSLAPLGHELDRWRHDLEIAALLSLPAQELLLAGGVTWEKLQPRDQAVVAGVVGVPPGGPAPDYSARVETRFGELPEHGGTILSLTILHRRSIGWATDLFGAALPLPGVGPPPELAPRGLVVERL